jgi:major membrane immunogen (membrane-anchored lipoprotein)
MRRAASFLIFLFIVLFPKSIDGQTLAAKKTQDTPVILKDGTYSGSSRAKYIYEPYWGKVSLTVKNNQLTDIQFSIRDSNLHENFDGNYEKHFAGNDVYINQSRNDWKGVQSYPAKLSDKQDINNVDAISGATWSYNIFKASVNDALKSAKQTEQ